MTVEERIERLERQNRRMKVAVSALVVALVGGVLLTGPLSPRQAKAQAAATPRIVEAREFRVVDAKGRERASLKTHKAGSGLVFYDENGKLRAMLCTTKDGSNLVLADENGKVRVSADARKDDQDSKYDGGPTLQLYNESHNTRLMLTVHNNQPVIALLDENGNYRALLDVGKDGGALHFADENQKTIWKAP